VYVEGAGATAGECRDNGGEGDGEKGGEGGKDGVGTSQGKASVAVREATGEARERARVERLLVAERAACVGLRDALRVAQEQKVCLSSVCVCVCVWGGGGGGGGWGGGGGGGGGGGCCAWRWVKLERLLCHVSVKRDLRALSFELWKELVKVSLEMG